MKNVGRGLCSAEGLDFSLLFMIHTLINYIEALN